MVGPVLFSISDTCSLPGEFVVQTFKDRAVMTGDDSRFGKGKEEQVMAWLPSDFGEKRR